MKNLGSKKDQMTHLTFQSQNARPQPPNSQPQSLPLHHIETWGWIKIIFLLLFRKLPRVVRTQSILVPRVNICGVRERGRKYRGQRKVHSSSFGNTLLIALWECNQLERQNR